MLADRESQSTLLELAGGRIVIAMCPLTLVDQTEPLLQLGQHCDRVPAVGMAVLEALAALLHAAAPPRRDEAVAVAERAAALARHLLDAPAPEHERARLCRVATPILESAG